MSKTAAAIVTVGFVSATASLLSFQVGGAIGAKWEQLGGFAGPVGAPLSDELSASYGGRYNIFQRGLIYWHPETGAHAVWGLIAVRWNELKNVEFGYPTTDEMKTPDGLGRYNHFRAVHLSGKREASIYWTPETGPHEVYGAIRAKWAEGGWERGPLGYPTTGEFQAGTYRQSNFQRGFIRWSTQTGAEVFAEKPLNVSETMTDRCSSDVSFPRLYGDTPNANGAIVLSRRPDGTTPWTGVFQRGLDGAHHVRWYCHSTIGNWADPGTWQLYDASFACSVSGTENANAGYNMKPSCDVPSGKIRTIDVNGWTAERSRCSSRTDRFRARLGPNRLLQIQCIQP